MGAAYFFLPDEKLMVTAYWGKTEPDQTSVLRAMRAADPARLKAIAHVIDLSKWERTTSTPQMETGFFRELGETYVATYGPLSTAIVAQRPHVFGQARVFETLASLRSPNLKIRVVKSWREASDFLGLDLTRAETEVERRRG